MCCFETVSVVLYNLFCLFVLLLIKETLSSLRVGSSELVSQAGLFVALLSQVVTGLQISRGEFAV